MIVLQPYWSIEVSLASPFQTHPYTHTLSILTDLFICQLVLVKLTASQRSDRDGASVPGRTPAEGARRVRVRKGTPDEPAQGRQSDRSRQPVRAGGEGLSVPVWVFDEVRSGRFVLFFFFFGLLLSNR